jgi:CheY-like chemotaxis protein
VNVLRQFTHNETNNLKCEIHFQTNETHPPDFNNNIIPEIGTIFDICPPMGTLLPQQESLFQKSPSSPGRILVVDDEPAVLFAYQKLIQAEGYEVDACEGLHEALVFLDTCSYIAVITDIRLSGSENTGGMQVLHATRRQQPHAKIIVVTGFGSNDVEQSIKSLGSSYYFEKPVKPSLIMELLKSST